MSIDSSHFTPVSSLLGGVLIGASATFLWLLYGRIAGISGVVAGLITPGVNAAERAWRWPFLVGLLAAGALSLPLWPAQFAVDVARSPLALLAAGLLVGYGTRLGNGCTSGHGVCGLSRASLRSLVATLTFVGTAGLTVWVIDHFFGGRL